MLAFVPPAEADEGCPCVRVDVVGSVTTSHTFTAAEIEGISPYSIVDPGYTFRTENGQPTQPGIDQPISLNALVNAVPTSDGATMSADAVTYTEVFDSDGVPHPLRAGDLGEAGHNGFPGGLMPAVYFVGGGLAYIRPLRDATDYNVSAKPNFGGFFPPTSGTLAITVHTTGALVEPRVHVVTRPDRTFDFTVTLETPAPDLTYDWEFGDAGRSAEAAPTHTYGPGAGTFPVVVSVRGSDGSWGRSDPVLVTLGELDDDPEPRHPGGGGGGGPKAPPVGPTKGSGHATGAKPDPTTSPTPSPDPGPGATDATSTPGSGPTVAQAPPKGSDGPRTSGRGGTVTGVVLADSYVAPAESAAPPTAPAARAGNRDRPLRLPGWVGLAAGAVLLLGLGALSESRWLDRRLNHGEGPMRP